MKSIFSLLFVVFFSLSADAFIDGSKCLRSEVYLPALKVFRSETCYTGLLADVNGNKLCVSRDSVGFRELFRWAGRGRFDVCARFNAVGYLVVTEIVDGTF